MDKKILEDQISGLKNSIKELRAKERIHIKANTLSEQIEKARFETASLQNELSKIKAKVCELQSKKEAALQKIFLDLSVAITRLLPTGEASVQINEGAVFMGWMQDKQGITPYLGLSGGEKAFFDLALTRALLGKSKEKILIGEVAEVDSENITKLLAKISEQHPDTQIILNTWSKPKEVPKEWKTIEL